jgi:hypothetical protein
VREEGRAEARGEVRSRVRPGLACKGESRGT